jgi:hypothetical protein
MSQDDVEIEPDDDDDDTMGDFTIGGSLDGGSVIGYMWTSLFMM